MHMAGAAEVETPYENDRAGYYHNDQNFEEETRYFQHQCGEYQHSYKEDDSNDQTALEIPRTEYFRSMLLLTEDDLYVDEIDPLSLGPEYEHQRDLDPE